MDGTKASGPAYRAGYRDRRDATRGHKIRVISARIEFLGGTPNPDPCDREQKS